MEKKGRKAYLHFWPSFLIRTKLEIEADQARPLYPRPWHSYPETEKKKKIDKKNDSYIFKYLKLLTEINGIGVLSRYPCSFPF